MQLHPSSHPELTKDLEYLIGCVEPYNVESISLEGNEQLAQNIVKIEKIFGYVIERLYDAVNLLQEGTDVEIRKYADIVICLGRELVELMNGEDVVKSIDRGYV